jgi:hypothetical protein
MAHSPEENSSDTKEEEDLIMDDDDVTVETATLTTKTDFIEAEMTEQTFRYEIPYRKGKASSEDFQMHTKLLIALTETFSDNVLRVFNNHNTRVNSFEEEKWMDEKYYKGHFTIHDDARQRKTVVIHRVQSTKSITQLKNDPIVLALLKKSNTFLRAHFWKEDEVLLKDLGFLSKYIPSKHSKAFVIQDIFERSEAVPDAQWAQAPPFQLIHSQPRVKFSGKTKSFKTHAYSIQVLAKDATSMNHFLQAIYEKEPLFMPYSMKRKFPQAVAKAILQQNQLMSDTFVVVITGISRDAMTSLKPTIMELPGTIAVSDTHKTDTSGRWYILVHEKSFRAVRKTISKSILSWFRALPSILREPVPPGFTEPQVHKKYFDTDDDSSSGQASYMSTCAQSYGSLDDDDIDVQYSSPPNEGSSMSYAAAVKRKTTPKASHSSDDTATTHPETVDVQNYRSVIAGLQSDVTIASLQAEVQSLRAQIRAQTGAQTPSTVTEASTHQKETPISERMSLMETSMAAMTREFSKWVESNKTKSTESDTASRREASDRPEASPNSTQSNKRTDTRSTPIHDNPMNTQPSLEDSSKQLFRENRSPFRETIMPSPHAYDPNRPQLLYCDHGDGSLYVVGEAGPNDFDEYGNIHGARPAKTQNPYSIQRASPSYIQQTRSYVRTQDTHHTNETAEQYQTGQPSPQRETRPPVTGSPQSLPAAGATTYHA